MFPKKLFLKKGFFAIKIDSWDKLPLQSLGVGCMTSVCGVKKILSLDKGPLYFVKNDILIAKVIYVKNSGKTLHFYLLMVC